MTGDLPDVVVVTVEELNLAYSTDAPATEARLAKKTIRVTGVVEKVVIKEEFDILYALLTGASRQQWDVRCTFDKGNIPDFDALNEGQKATIQGKFEGRQRNIILNDCTVVH